MIKILPLILLILTLNISCSDNKLENNESNNMISYQMKTESIKNVADSLYVDNFVDDFGVVIKSAKSQETIEKIVIDNRKIPFDMNKDGILRFHSIFGNPEKTSLSQAQDGKLLNFYDIYDGAEIGFRGDGSINYLIIKSNFIKLKNGISIGSSIDDVKKYYPDGFYYSKETGDELRTKFTNNKYYFIKINKYGGGDGIIFHHDDSGLIDKISIGEEAFVK